MIRAERNVLIEAKRLKTLRMYEYVNNSILLLDPLSGKWYSVPTEYVEHVKEPWRDPWTQAAVARLEVDESQWKTMGGDNIYLRSPYDYRGDQNARLVKTDKNTFAVTWAVYEKIGEDIYNTNRNKPEDTTSTFYSIEIVLSDPDLLEADEYEWGRDPIVLYRAAEVRLSRLDIPF